jgi:hypothetical protein
MVWSVSVMAIPQRRVPGSMASMRATNFLEALRRDEHAINAVDVASTRERHSR